MCIFVIVLASVICAACLFANKKQRARIKELELEVEYRNTKIAKMRERYKRLFERYMDVREELSKTPARGTDGRYTSRSKQ